MTSYRALREDNRITRQAISKIVKRLEWLQRPVHHRSADNIAIVNEVLPKTRIYRFLVFLRNYDCLTAHYGVFYI